MNSNNHSYTLSTAILDMDNMSRGQKGTEKFERWIPG